MNLSNFRIYALDPRPNRHAHTIFADVIDDYEHNTSKEPKQPVIVDAQTIEALRRLGYVH